MPEWLTRKIGPLPAWGWAAVGAGALLVYRLRKSRSSATSATPTSANYSASVPNPQTESVTTPSGFSYTGPPTDLSSLIPLGALSSTSGSTQSSGVVGNWGGNPQEQGVTFQPVTTGQVLPQYTTLYDQPVPGTFNPVAPGSYGSLAPNTQLYALPVPTQPFGLQQWGYGGSATGLKVPAA